MKKIHALICRLELDLELTAAPEEDKDVKCADNSTRELQEKSKEMEDNSSREVEVSNSKEDEKGSTEISMESKGSPK